MYKLYLIFKIRVLIFKGQTKVGESLTTSEGFNDTFGLKAKESAKNAARDHFGFDLPDELVISQKADSIGVSILKSMRQNGSGPAKKLIGASLPDKKPDFDIMVEFIICSSKISDFVKKNVKYKEDHHGLGNGFSTREEGDWFSAQFQSMFRSRSKKEDKNEEEESEKERLKNRVMFGGFTGPLETEECNDFPLIFESDSHYSDSNFEISQEEVESSSKSHPAHHNSKKVLGNTLENLVKSSKPYILPLQYNPFLKE